MTKTSMLKHLTQKKHDAIKPVSQEEYQLFREVFLEGLTQSQAPTLIIFAGAPGAGKTTYRKTHFSHVNNFHLHDMDEILIRLQGYQKDYKTLGARKAFENWWPTAQAVANQLVKHAFEHQYNVLYDRTCGTKESFDALYNAVSNLGYKAKMYAFTMPEEKALARIQQREKMQGRTVTPEIVKEYTNHFNQLLPRYLTFIEEVHLFFNDQEIFCQPPTNAIKKDVR